MKRRITQNRYEGTILATLFKKKVLVSHTFSPRTFAQDSTFSTNKVSDLWPIFPFHN